MKPSVRKMAKVESFEDLEIWKMAFAISLATYELTAKTTFAKDFGLRDQMKRASVSIMSNIAEGFERGSDKDFARFLFIAKASAAELRSQLHLCKALVYITEPETRVFDLDLKLLSKKIFSLITYLRKDN